MYKVYNQCKREGKSLTAIFTFPFNSGSSFTNIYRPCSIELALIYFHSLFSVYRSLILCYSQSVLFSDCSLFSCFLPLALREETNAISLNHDSVDWFYVWRSHSAKPCLKNIGKAFRLSAGGLVRFRSGALIFLFFHPFQLSGFRLLYLLAIAKPLSLLLRY